MKPWGPKRRIWPRGSVCYTSHMAQTLDSGRTPRKTRKRPLVGVPLTIKASALAFAEQVQNTTLAAETFGVSEKAIRNWRKTLTPEEIARGAETLAQEWEERAFRFLAQADALSADATFMQLITAASIATEKRTLLRGKEVQGQHSPADPDVLRAKLREMLQDKAKANAREAVLEHENPPPDLAKGEGGEETEG